MKFAYLIAAHNEEDLLCALLRVLDDEKNDLYIHVDKKSVIDIERVRKTCEISRVCFVNRYDVVWGDSSQISMELELLKEATKEFHDYYHYISGVDFPLKTNSYIQKFFCDNAGKEFVQFDYHTYADEINFRIGYYHFFQKYIGRKNGILKKLDTLFCQMQGIVGFSRIKGDSEIYKKGANWFSITHSLAVYVVSRSDYILKKYKYTNCSDEIFLQTLVFNSEFKNNIFYSNEQKRYINMRYVDWDRGNPYVFMSGDYEELKSVNYIFARKFSMQRDSEIIERLTIEVKEQ